MASDVTTQPIISEPLDRFSEYVPLFTDVYLICGPAARTYGAVINLMMPDKAELFHRIEKIAAVSGLSVRQTKRDLRELTDSVFLKVYKGGYRRTMTYSLRDGITKAERMKPPADKKAGFYRLPKSSIGQITSFPAQLVLAWLVWRCDKRGSTYLGDQLDCGLSFVSRTLLLSYDRVQRAFAMLKEKRWVRQDGNEVFLLLEDGSDRREFGTAGRGDGTDDRRDLVPLRRDCVTPRRDLVPLRRDCVPQIRGDGPPIYTNPTSLTNHSEEKPTNQQKAGRFSSSLVQEGMGDKPEDSELSTKENKLLEINSSTNQCHGNQSSAITVRAMRDSSESSERSLPERGLLIRRLLSASKSLRANKMDNDCTELVIFVLTGLFEKCDDERSSESTIEVNDRAHAEQVESVIAQVFTSDYKPLRANRSDSGVLAKLMKEKGVFPIYCESTSRRRAKNLVPVLRSAAQSWKAVRPQGGVQLFAIADDQWVPRQVQCAMCGKPHLNHKPMFP